MKKLITNYTFDPIAKTVVFTDYDTIDLSQVLLITNTTDNVMKYSYFGVWYFCDECWR